MVPIHDLIKSTVFTIQKTAVAHCTVIHSFLHRFAVHLLVEEMYKNPHLMQQSKNYTSIIQDFTSKYQRKIKDYRKIKKRRRIVLKKDKIQINRPRAILILSEAYVTLFHLSQLHHILHPADGLDPS